MSFDPDCTRLGIPAEEQPANYCRPLGLRLFEENAQVIDNAADRQMAYVRTFQAGNQGKHLQVDQVAARADFSSDGQSLLIGHADARFDSGDLSSASKLSSATSVADGHARVY